MVLAKIHSIGMIVMEVSSTVRFMQRTQTAPTLAMILKTLDRRQIKRVASVVVDPLVVAAVEEDCAAILHPTRMMRKILSLIVLGMLEDRDAPASEMTFPTWVRLRMKPVVPVEAAR